MRFNEIGNSGVRVSVIGAGTWAMGGDFWGAIEEQNCIDSIRTSLDCGVNLVDTAPAYGQGYSETLVGKAIAGRRGDVFLATKCGLVWENEPRTVKRLTKASIMRECEQSLKRLGTDYIDLYQMHWPDVTTPIEESMEALTLLREQGKIRFIGASNFDVALMERAGAAGVLDTLQPQYSLLEREIEKDILPYCRKKGIGVLSYGSLGAGMLTGKFTTPPKGDNRALFYKFFKEPAFSKGLELVSVLSGIAARHDKPVAHVAINWVSQQPGMLCALVGSKNPAQAKMNAEAGDWALSADELKQIEDACARIYA